MKFRALLSLMIFFSCLGSVQAQDKSFLFLQQEKPGQIIYVSFNARGKDALVAVVGMGRETIEKRFKISLKEFNKYWEVLHSDDLQKYRHSPKEGESVTDVDFYTINVQSDSDKALLKLPNTGLNDSANELLKSIQGYIPNKR